MKLICEKERLLNQIQKVQISNIRSHLPILNNILLSAKRDSLTAVGTDMEISIKYEQQMKIEREGSVLLPTRKLIEVINSLSGDINIDVDDNMRTTISSEKFISHLVGMKEEEYPLFPDIKWDTSFVIPIHTLLDMLKKIEFSASQDETFVPFCGIYMALKDGKIVMVSTDGHRLSLAEREVDTDIKEDISIIIPIKSIHEIMKVFRGEEGDVTISITEKEIGIEYNGISFVSRLLEGEFPDYDKVIPKDNLIEVSLDRENLYLVIKRVSLMSSEKKSFVKFELEDNTLSISASSQDLGDAEEDIETEYSGDKIKIFFNPRYITDVLRHTTSEKILLNITQTADKGMIRIPKDEGLLYVIMPMKI
jgi:DNA polymerase-3 subunit beta